MKRMHAFSLLATASLLAACSSVETTRNAPIVDAPVQSAIQAVRAPDWHVAEVRVIVPETLLASEANVYLPAADIVWREDPLGNRHEQVGRIIRDAVARGTAHLSGARAVTVDVELRQFHALSDKARATVGGSHKITFDYVIRDAETGLDLTPPKRIETGLAAYGGLRAMAAVRRGETQKVRITQHLAGVMAEEFGIVAAPVAVAASKTPAVHKFN